MPMPEAQNQSTNFKSRAHGRSGQDACNWEIVARLVLDEGFDAPVGSNWFRYDLVASPNPFEQLDTAVEGTTKASARSHCHDTVEENFHLRPRSVCSTLQVKMWLDSCQLLFAPPTTSPARISYAIPQLSSVLRRSNADC